MKRVFICWRYEYKENEKVCRTIEVLKQSIDVFRKQNGENLFFYRSPNVL